MKKITFLIVFAFYCNVAFSQTIHSLNVSPNSSNTVDVNINVIHNDYIQFKDYLVETIGNVITLKVCYEYDTVPSASNLNNTFTIPINDNISYTLNIEIYRVLLTLSCDYLDMIDNATLEFTTPLTATVYLGVEDFKAMANKVTLYPNPVKGEVNIIKANDLTIHKLEVYTMLGSKIKTVRSQFERLDVTNFSDGLYFLTFHSNKGVFQKKIIISN